MVVCLTALVWDNNNCRPRLLARKRKRKILLDASLFSSLSSVEHPTLFWTNRKKWYISLNREQGRNFEIGHLSSSPNLLLYRRIIHPEFFQKSSWVGQQIPRSYFSPLDSSSRLPWSPFRAIFIIPRSLEGSSKTNPPSKKFPSEELIFTIEIFHLPISPRICSYKWNSLEDLI